MYLITFFMSVISIKTNPCSKSMYDVCILTLRNFIREGSIFGHICKHFLGGLRDVITPILQTHREPPTLPKCQRGIPWESNIAYFPTFKGWVAHPFYLWLARTSSPLLFEAFYSFNWLIILHGFILIILEVLTLTLL